MLYVMAASLRSVIKTVPISTAGLCVKGGPTLIADTAATTSAMRRKPDPHGAISGPDALTCRGTGAARNVADDDGRGCHLAILLITATAIRIINVAIVYFRMYAG